MKCVSAVHEHLNIVGWPVFASINNLGEPQLYMLWKLSIVLTKLRCRCYRGCNSAQRNGVMTSQNRLHEAQIYMRKSILLREMCIEATRKQTRIGLD
jgi:hypothetical protein